MHEGMVIFRGYVKQQEANELNEQQQRGYRARKGNTLCYNLHGMVQPSEIRPGNGKIKRDHCGPWVTRWTVGVEAPPLPLLLLRR